MSRRLKKFGSSLGLGRRRGEVEDDQRNVTPPSSSIPVDDTLTTPPQQMIGTGPTATPDDAIITTPPTTQLSSPVKSSLVKRIFSPFKPLPPRTQQATEVVATKKMHTQGITGSDPSLPIFTGRSAYITEHLIDLETDSMETAPDVRVYFWIVGNDIAGEPTPPANPDEREAFDAKLVREGRQYLRDFREDGCGWFLSSEREIGMRNEPGTTWYRMPTTGICHDIGCGIISPMESEGFFYDSAREPSGIELSPSFIATNLRVPLWWVETLKDGVVPGTKGWDEAIKGAYTDGFHPGYITYKGEERDEMILNLVNIDAGPATDDDYACDRQKAELVLRRDWPKLQRPARRSQDEFIGPGPLEFSGHTIDEFLGRTK